MWGGENEKLLTTKSTELLHKGQKSVKPGLCILCEFLCELCGYKSFKFQEVP